MSKVIGKVKAVAVISLGRSEINKILNKHYIGTDNCNIYENGRITPIEHSNRKKLEKAHKNITTNLHREIEVDILEDGNIGKIRFT